MDLVFESDGSNERVRFTGDGNVGIGTDTPDVMLDVQGDSGIRLNSNANASHAELKHSGSGVYTLGTYNYSDGGNIGGELRFATNYNQGNPHVDRMTITNDGNVGIGTDNPAAKLHVAATGTASLVSATINEVSDFAVAARVGFSGLTNNNDGAYFGMGVDGGISAGMGFFREGSGWSSALSFYTNNQTSGTYGVDAIQEQMRITSAGKVGIGTASPLYKLHVSGTGHQRLLVEKTDAGGDADIQLKSPSDSTQWILFNDSTSGNNSGVIKYIHSTNKMHFRTNDVDDRLVISSNGGVGIGTDSPLSGYKLDVAGNIVIPSGNFLANRSAGGSNWGLIRGDDSGTTFLGDSQSIQAHSSGLTRIRGPVVMGTLGSGAGVSVLQVLGVSHSSGGPTSFNIDINNSGWGEYYAEIRIVGVAPFSTGGYFTQEYQVTGYGTGGVTTIKNIRSGPGTYLTFSNATSTTTLLRLPVAAANGSYRFNVMTTVYSIVQATTTPSIS